MQNVLCRDGFAADAAFRKGHVLGNGFVEVVADHQHVEMFFERVHGERTSRVCRGWQNKVLATDADDVGGMAAACAFGVEGVDGPALHRGYGIFHETRLVQRIGVDHHLHVPRIRDRKAAVDCAGRGAPILVQFERAGTAKDLFLKCRRK